MQEELTEKIDQVFQGQSQEIKEEYMGLIMTQAFKSSDPREWIKKLIQGDSTQDDKIAVNKMTHTQLEWMYHKLYEQQRANGEELDAYNIGSYLDDLPKGVAPF